MARPGVEITATIGNQVVSRSAVLEWENKRIDAAARKLRLPAPPSAPVAQRREAWLHAKSELGDDEIHRRLTRDVKLADTFARWQSKVSEKRRACAIDLTARGGPDAEFFTNWFEEITFSSNQDAMELSCPDHFVLRMVGGKQEVLETNGGSPFTALFTIDYDDVSSLTTAIDPRFPFRLDGVARSADGTAIGGVRHQFRDTADGLHARLVVEFPLLILGRIIRGHRWHLACEFSNWIESAAAERP
ncbi:hypothetical protein [Mycolicibacterium brumae]|uniref:DUF1990 domain-containing protein n=1 Tax=Mycolicibacterium brumae TaxID=85968 RepID=A0A2G5PGJ4_9MYCO|nr:hypothetical protein [Mycolicibacterium brumae]MCV7194329.1 hypothetical protein [Mycolicibacterium brumae]PIB77270.1 hypothetical protein CQY22_003255 [Mycolicibacterium brumae]RWA15523.1 hypothetical protein MBRU_10760 [Mycolicibacterium brumae DSM 44177]UWW10634.1 hypothetical protein L2Z93_003768 [Mycolicibacterium brumae]